jgi:hypothetical protein
MNENFFFFTKKFGIIPSLSVVAVLTAFLLCTASSFQLLGHRRFVTRPLYRDSVRVCPIQPSMLLDKINLLQTANIILASGSPRRKEILNDLLKLKVNIIPSTFEENLDKSQFTPEAYVQENARLKALEVWNRLASTGTRFVSP